eukprot:s1551_g29.t2
MLPSVVIQRRDKSGWWAEPKKREDQRRERKKKESGARKGDYTLSFSYFRSGKDAKLSVQYESVVGKSVEVKIFGDEAVTVRFQLLTTDKSTSGAALDHVTLVPRSRLGHSRVSSHQQNFLEYAVDAFNNLLDAIFSRKYEDQHVRGRGPRAPWATGPAPGRKDQVAGSISVRPLQVLTVAVVASVAFFGLFFAWSRHRFRWYVVPRSEHERLIDEPEIFSAREFAREIIPSDVI